MWHELRDPQTNKLLAKYDPDQRLLEIGSRGVYRIIDLALYDRAPDSTRAGHPHPDHHLADPPA